MTLLSFISQPVTQNGQTFTTKMYIESINANVTRLELARGSQVIYSTPCIGVPVFTIRFDLYDLSANQMTDVSVTYSPDNPYGGIGDALNVIASGTDINYTNVQPSVTGYSPVNPPEFSPINVRLRFTGASGAAAGSVVCDIAYTYPREFRPEQKRYAWQPTLMFPRVAVAKDETAIGDARRFGDYSLLTPNGDYGRMGGLGTFGQRTVVQFASLYKIEERAQPNPFAEGFAMFATDVRGNQKAFIFDGHGDQGELAFHLTSPIFLKTKQYVKPSAPNDPGYDFVLSKEDGQGQGFGGALTYYWLRAFHLESTYAGAPLDWRNVADLYRDWVLAPDNKGRRQYFGFKKHARSTDGPIDNMSPHTIICNYGLDGPAAPPDATTTDEVRKKTPAWLEIHPIKPSGASADVPGNMNESLRDALFRMRSKVGNPKARLEVQLWGFERGGFYHLFGGYPPITDALSGKGRFKAAMDEIYGAQPPHIYLNITTDPLDPELNRRRFGGHLRWIGGGSTEFDKSANWESFISTSFPEKFVTEFCGLTGTFVKDDDNPNDKGYNLTRAFLVRDNPTFHPQPNCQDVKDLFKYPLGTGSDRQSSTGVNPAGGGLLATSIYQQEFGSLCLTEQVESFYRNNWLGTVFSYGARLVEFMKIWAFGWDSCYKKEHQHILPRLSATLPYDNVIGYGPWAVKRLQAMFDVAHDVGLAHDPSFALTIEAAPLEMLLPYVNEYYHNSPLFHYVYSELISVKMEIGEYPPYVHPGYKERRTQNAPYTLDNLPKPTFMLERARDDEELPDRARWRAECEAYFEANFRVASYGLAPRFYPKGEKKKTEVPLAPKPSEPLEPAFPLAPTNPPTYTYCRALQDVYNLRAYIFNVGQRAVLGERVHLSAYIMERTTDYDQSYVYYDYNEELVQIMTRAIHMQIRHAQYFRGGRMMGKTAVTLLPPAANANAPGQKVRAWRAGFRGFEDVKPFREQIGGGLDFLSLSYDSEAPYEVIAERLPHMIWRTEIPGFGLCYMYVFANVGNSALRFRFNYTHGGDIPGELGKVVRVFDGRNRDNARNIAGYDPSGAPDELKPVTLGSTETIFETYPLAERSFAVIALRAR
jgi:hypothetical protein